MRGALNSIASEEGGSELAKRARSCAEALLSYTTTNTEICNAFADVLIERLEKCFQNKSRSVRIQRERLCENLFKLRSSETHKQMWSTFLLKTINFRACPIFYQAITDQIIEELTKVHFPIPSSSQSTAIVPDLDIIELNAIRYMAGYVVQSLKKKVESTAFAHRDKSEIRLCLSELEGDRG